MARRTSAGIGIGLEQLQIEEARIHVRDDAARAHLATILEFDAACTAALDDHASYRRTQLDVAAERGRAPQPWPA